MITTPTVSGKPGQAPTGLSCDLYPLIGSHSIWTDPRGPVSLFGKELIFICDPQKTARGEQVRAICRNTRGMNLRHTAACDCQELASDWTWAPRLDGGTTPSFRCVPGRSATPAPTLAACTFALGARMGHFPRQVERTGKMLATNERLTDAWIRNTWSSGKNAGPKRPGATPEAKLNEAAADVRTAINDLKTKIEALKVVDAKPVPWGTGQALCCFRRLTELGEANRTPQGRACE